MDKDGLSDPYVKLSVIDSFGRTVGESKKTKAVKNDLNPFFEQRYHFRPIYVLLPDILLLFQMFS